MEKTGRRWCLLVFLLEKPVLFPYVHRGAAPLPGTLRWARFLSDEKSGKESPKAGPSPALWNPPRRYWVEGASFFFRPLARWGHIDGRIVRLGVPTPLPVHPSTARALPWKSSCSQLPVDWLSAVATPLFQSRPGRENHLAIGPAAQGGLVWWQYQGPQQGSRAGLRLDAGPASYPREVLRGERPKWLFVHFGQSKWTPAERPPGWQGLLRRVTF